MPQAKLRLHHKLSKKRAPPYTS